MSKPTSKTTTILLALLVVAAATLGVLKYRKSQNTVPKTDPPRPANKVENAKPAANTKKNNPSNNRKTVKTARDPAEKAKAMEELPEELRNKLEALDEAVSGDDEEAVAKLAHELLATGSHEARLEAAESLAFAGFAGFSDLTSLLMDPDDEVREAARSSWESRINEIDDTPTKIRLYEAATKLVLDVDPEYLEELIDDASVDLTDHQMLEMLLPLYDLTENEESRKVILEEIDDVISPDEESKTIEEAKKNIDEWLKDNPPEVDDGDDD
ncbi:MAG: hypothetical protein IJU44_03150 [Kiritimatiellae bacterium]|nr:hypothetical protein [Kiritimatiellia bacterium]